MTFLIAGFLMASILTGSPEATNTKIVEARIGNKLYQLEVPDSNYKKYLGLSGRKSMPKDSGMLFIFPTLGQRTFCMVDMQFPLDFVWVSGNTVVYLNENVPPAKKQRQDLRDEEILDAGQPTNIVIELNAGEIKKNQIKVGDKILFTQQK